MKTKNFDYDQLGLGPLGLLPTFKTSADVKQKLEILDSFDMEREEMIARSCVRRPEFGAQFKEHLVPALIREFKRFFALKLLFPDAKYPLTPASSVDAVWQVLILDSVRYYDLCKNVYGDYLHHKVITDELIGIYEGEIFDYTVDCMKSAFGGLVNVCWFFNYQEKQCWN
ncbi:MAG: hypothetical protein KDC73_08865 [Ignavibacteriae bacterium]|nr:hypothetical protein [Ignavibacteriota bacterium]MCB9242180.1 hypothetical protein [Ignavibacteriales bacterium]